MSITKHFAAVLIAGAALVVGANAQGKGPQGAGSGTMPSHSASPTSQGIGSNSWTSNPPGWSKAEDSKGWDAGTSPPAPPGWDNNATGQEHGWGADSTTAQGLEKH